MRQEKVVSVNTARRALDSLVDEVVETGRPYILQRDDRPAVVIIPYDDYVASDQDGKWQAELDAALQETNAHFAEWLRQRGYPENLTDDEIERIIQQA